VKGYLRILRTTLLGFKLHGVKGWVKRKALYKGLAALKAGEAMGVVVERGVTYLMDNRNQYAVISRNEAQKVFEEALTARPRRAPSATAIGLKKLGAMLPKVIAIGILLGTLVSHQGQTQADKGSSISRLRPEMPPMPPDMGGRMPRLRPYTSSIRATVYESPKDNEYYALLRWVVCTVSAWEALCAAKVRKHIWLWTFAVIAVVFNPIMPFRVARETWAFVDGGVAVLFLFSIVAFNRQPLPAPKE